MSNFGVSFLKLTPFYLLWSQLLKHFTLFLLIKSVDSHIINIEPGMCDHPVILNLQILKRESYISVICQAIIAVEDKKADADTHLAEARRQNTGNGILGDLRG